MGMGKVKKGIRLLIVIYCFLIFQHFSMRKYFSMNSGLEAVFIGTLIYLVFGFIRRMPASRWTAIVFHGLFQALEIAAFFIYLNSDALAALVKNVPGATIAVARVSFIAVFTVISVINIGAISYLLKNKDYFVPGREEGQA
jgi:hypothetical protein